MDKKYTCKKCEWTGTTEELESDVVEGCFGDDEVEMCPVCGSYEVFEMKI